MHDLHQPLAYWSRHPDGELDFKARKARDRISRRSARQEQKSSWREKLDDANTRLHAKRRVLGICPHLTDHETNGT